MLKKAGFILFLAGLTLGLTAVGYFDSWNFGIAAVVLLVLGAILLVVGMLRSGPRDEELPTADAAVPRGTHPGQPPR